MPALQEAQWFGELTLWLQQEQPHGCECAKCACRSPVHNCMHRHAELVEHATARFCSGTGKALLKKEDSGDIYKSEKEGARGAAVEVTHLSQASSGKKSAVSECCMRAHPSH